MIEVRVMDAVSRVEEAIALAAYIKALIRCWSAADEAGHAPPACRPVIAQVNKWGAARYGLAASVVDHARGGSCPRGAGS